ncbi:MAG TPA: DNA-directed RNA polymerase subunit omega [Sedimentisphaerales bacterium]|nr:DNA-directed RNA polymerase subunit omega [Sedimentisphaerales bacterium]HRS12323.1 DNA-directed RNA polymerase subunit omega [Sedimentisphaerales bacterium]HRV48994.1 DNA-directed RNA polymerase subunit omega [Sedimentisphaerales bacterium]
MLDQLKSAEIVNKVGGRFKLAALVQKRMAELLQGSRPLIDDPTGLTMLEIVAQEIIQDKIAIDMNSDVGKGEADQWRLKL